MSRQFAAIKRLSTEHDVPAAIAYLANHVEDFSVIERLAVAEGLSFFEVSTAFRDTDYKQMKIHLLDGYLNSAAHKIIADSLIGQLQESGLLPEE